MILQKRQINVSIALDRLGIVGGHVSNNNLVTHCPWPENHEEGDAHASFAVHQETGAWICWAGCGQGLLLSLVKRIRNNDERDARIWLLSTAGGEVDFTEVEKALDMSVNSNNSSEEAAKVAKADYSLMRKDVVSSYLLDRGFTVDSVISWGIRHDRGSNAAVIPIYGRNGKDIVGLVRRMVPPILPGYPKYLYTKGFDKRSHLFGIHRHTGNDIIVVEGPLDAIWLHQHGYSETVALMGASCSTTQLHLLKSLGNRITLALDGDEAGNAAAEKLYQRLRRHVPVTLATLPDRLDVQNLQGPQLQELFSQSKYAWE